jgi:hypothetical protein
MASERKQPIPAASAQKTQRTIMLGNAHANAAHQFMNNYVRTTKYTWYNFLPRNLFEQFHRAANVYFLCLVILNWIPILNVFGKEVSCYCVFGLASSATTQTQQLLFAVLSD